MMMLKDCKKINQPITWKHESDTFCWFTCVSSLSVSLLCAFITFASADVCVATRKPPALLKKSICPFGLLIIDCVAVGQRIPVAESHWTMASNTSNPQMEDLTTNLDVAKALEVKVVSS